MADQKTGSEFSASAGFGIGQSHCELTVRKQNALSAFDRLADGFVAMDHEFRYTLINDEAERICQKRRDEMIGRTYWDLFRTSSTRSPISNFGERWRSGCRGGRNLLPCRHTLVRDQRESL
jgi:PAS domain-containing protein